MPAARRVFLKALAVVPLAPQAASSTAPSAAQAPPETGTGAVAEALAETARREFAPQLDTADVAAVTRELVRSLEAAQRLRAGVLLRNGDEPATVFDPRPPDAVGKGKAREGRR